MKNSSLENRYMEFRLGDAFYAIPLLNVKEVIRKPEITDVPNMPSHFEGMINLRGQILGVFNVRKRLNSKPKATGPELPPEVVIVVEKDGVNVGMIVDEVTRVLHPLDDSMQPAPLKDDDPAKKYIEAVIKTEEALVLTVHVGVLLDLDKYKHQAQVA